MLVHFFLIQQVGKYHLVNFLFKALFLNAFILKSQMFWEAFHFCQDLLHFGTFLYFIFEPRIHEWKFCILIGWKIPMSNFSIQSIFNASLTPL